MAEFVARKVAVIVASPLQAALAAKATATTIPTVFQIGLDPVKVGLVASFSRPGANFTGVSQLSTALVAKRLELLHAIAPNATLIAALVDPQAPNREEQLTILQDAARALGVRTLILDSREIDTAFASIVSQQVGALFVAASSYWTSHREQIVLLAARHRVPACYESRDFRRAAAYVHRNVSGVCTSISARWKRCARRMRWPREMMALRESTERAATPPPRRRAA
jgi:putative ABC transport system substrate-binding protein